MVVSRSSCKPMTNKINEEVAEKYHNNSLPEHIEIIICSSSDDGNISSFNTMENPIVITISDDDVAINEYLSDRPKRNIERTNYNQSKMMKNLYNRDTLIKPTSDKLIAKKRSRENRKLAKATEKAIKKLAKAETEPNPPPNTIDMDNLLSSISSSSKQTAAICKPISKRLKISNDESPCSKLGQISNRAFKYPWEWLNEQKSISCSRILGFRTLDDGLCETLMCRK